MAGSTESKEDEKLGLTPAMESEFAATGIGGVWLHRRKIGTGGVGSADCELLCAINTVAGAGREAEVGVGGSRKEGPPNCLGCEGIGTMKRKSSLRVLRLRDLEEQAHFFHINSFNFDLDIVTHFFHINSFNLGDLIIVILMYISVN
ncbi:hypothetical protein MA16_Dca001155 [Dendrobium catenatum]|uniref:Uncharacterized protein n=1 Tax=Dendrobium catenatum TaxID=906689 RepID=A0A2I0WLM3_9ASPA|nr:hypothetical protein MA16_Dca001155 [Dendrobium catenatum]